MNEYIKFECRLTDGSIPEQEAQELNKWRTKLKEKKLIGFKENYGYGNISKKTKNGFIISGTNTGKKKELKAKDFSEVTKTDFKKNFLECKGKIKASSESLTHAAIYSSNKKINAVIHVHSIDLWKKLENVPVVKSENGTKELAFEIKKLMKRKEVKEKKIIVMKGHKEGIICFGKNLEQAGNTLLNYLNGINSEFQKNLSAYLKKKGLKLEKKIAKGHSSEIFLVKKGKKEFALKIEKTKSTRKNMAEKEVKNLRKANSVKVGPDLIDFDLKKKIILMELIKGKTFSEWLFSLKKKDKKKLEKFIKKLMVQAGKLDEIGLDHGQLAGRGVNILERNGKPVIIDFEKASSKRKTHNKTVLEAFLFRNPESLIAKKVKEILS